MANDLRRRDIGIGGTITNNPLASGATTLNSAELAAIVGGIGATEYMAITLDPDQVAGAPEVCYITALTAGATSATVIRGVEGTSTRSHVLGTTWRHAITPADVPRTADILGGGDLGFDYEFEANTASLPTGWSWVNQGAATYAEANGAGVLTSPTAAGGADEHRLIVRSLSGFPAAWSATAKLAFSSYRPGSQAGFGMYLRESSSGKIMALQSVATSAAASAWRLAHWTNTAGAGGVADVGYDELTAGGMWIVYVRITKVSATSWNFDISPDGYCWFNLDTHRDISTFLTPDQIGFGTELFNTARSSQGAIHWLRVR